MLNTMMNTCLNFMIDNKAVPAGTIDLTNTIKLP